MSSPNPIGGGGGQGGSAAANAFALGLASPIDNQSYVGTIDFTLGGTGGSGGTAGAVTANVNAGTSITTRGQGSHSVLAQSIGGGGGDGGDSSAMAARAPS